MAARKSANDIVDLEKYRPLVDEFLLYCQLDTGLAEDICRAYWRMRKAKERNELKKATVVAKEKLGNPPR